MANDFDFFIISLNGFWSGGSNRTEKFKTFNVGSEDEIDIKNIAIKLSRKYNSKVIMPSLKKNNGFDKYIPDISKFRKKYNYKKKLSSCRAILKTINQLSFSEHSK